MHFFSATVKRNLLTDTHTGLRGGRPGTNGTVVAPRRVVNVCNRGRYERVGPPWPYTTV